MRISHVTAKSKLSVLNRGGFTFLAAIFMVMIIGIMLGMTGLSWKTIMKREREKELLFRGSQIKEAIENWYNPAYSVRGVKWAASHPLLKLEDLLKNPYTLEPLRYLPQSYETELDTKNLKCGSDCPKLKLNQDPMTGKEWELVKCDISTTTNEICMKFPGGNNAIIGVASKSDEEPLRSLDSFKDTALENLGKPGGGNTPGKLATGSPFDAGGETASTSGAGDKMKYSQWKFIAESPQKNDHTKIYRAYHEGW